MSAKIFRGLENLPSDLGNTVVTIGNFDGVHCGHRWVIDHVIDCARVLSARAIAVTLDPHPAKLLRPDRAPLLITPGERKLELLAETGLDAVLVLPFDATLANTSARDFATNVLHGALHAQEVHEGENFRFGHDAEAGTDGLAALGRELGFSVHAYAPQSMRGQAISSSRIRTLIAAGDLPQARALLGREFTVDSTPASGRGYGTQYAVPTINLAPYAELLPANGVYVTRLEIGEGNEAVVFDGVTNVGNRPTFGADSFAVESHLFDFHPVALTETTPLRLTFELRLRDEIRFPSTEALKEQIGRDIAKAQRYLRLRKAQKTVSRPVGSPQV
jgi:riboflavin kinase / FMN adenylyltransferase